MRQRGKEHLQNFGRLSVVDRAEQSVVSLMESVADLFDLLILVERAIQNVELDSSSPSFIELGGVDRPRTCIRVGVKFLVDREVVLNVDELMNVVDP